MHVETGFTTSAFGNDDPLRDVAPLLVPACAWKAKEARLTSEDLNCEPKQAFALSGSTSHFTLTFGPPVFASGGR